MEFFNVIWVIVVIFINFALLKLHSSRVVVISLLNINYNIKTFKIGKSSTHVIIR